MIHNGNLYVTNLDELNALPGGAVVLSEQGGIWIQSSDRRDQYWNEPGRETRSESTSIALSAKVHHLPDHETLVHRADELTAADRDDLFAQLDALRAVMNEPFPANSYHLNGQENRYLALREFYDRELPDAIEKVLEH